MKINIIYIFLIFVATTLSLKANDAKLFTPLYTFKDVSINHLNWSKSSEKKTAYRDFTYLEVEGGAGWTWGEFYGFFDIENPLANYEDTSAKGLRIALKPILDIKLYENIYFHIQDYYLNSELFYVNNLVSGISYKLASGNNFWMKPFIGVHYQDDTYFHGFNGYMFGWQFYYNFKILNENFTLFQWHEMEFQRAKEYYQLSDGSPKGDGKSNGINGALSFWYNINESFTTGLQYRYTSNKLGYDEDLSAVIYSFKYYF